MCAYFKGVISVCVSCDEDNADRSTRPDELFENCKPTHIRQRNVHQEKVWRVCFHSSKGRRSVPHRGDNVTVLLNSVSYVLLNQHEVFGDDRSWTV